MNYIVIDLEWNQSPNGKREEVREIPFEIIEIGAVKLDSSFRKIDKYSRLIKPQIYKEIHSITRKIIHIEMEDLLKEETFEYVIKDFFNWCGTDYMFATWGNMDLIELQRNLMYYNLVGYIEKPIPFYDVQKLFALSYFNNKVPRTLEAAVDTLKIKKDKEFHRAYVDAKYTAEILKTIDKDLIVKNYSMDFFHNPKSKEEELNLIYDTYTKFISQEYSTKEELMKTKEICNLQCIKCKQRITKKIRWFTNNSKNYYSLGYCKKHGYIKSKIRIKRSYSNKVFAVKVTKLIDENEANAIINKYFDYKKRKISKKIKDTI